jgi:excisionase family DNA binding protein
MEKRYLSLSEAADALDISERTAYRWIKSGKLHAFKPGRDYRIPETAIEEAIEKGEVRPKEPASSQRSFNGLLEEERRVRWESAVEEARALRENGQAQMLAQLSAWRASKAREEDPSKRRECREAMADLLQEAWNAATALVRSYSLERNWEEVRDADRHYYLLRGMVEGQEGLFVRAQAEIVEDAA